MLDKLALVYSKTLSDGKLHLYLTVISLVQFLRHFDPNLSMTIECLYAINKNDEENFFDHSILKNVTTIENMITSVNQHPDYYIFDCELHINQNIKITCADDSEITITFNREDKESWKAIESIFTELKIPQSTKREVSRFKGKYISLNENYSIKGTFDSFENYLNNSSLPYA